MDVGRILKMNLHRDKIITLTNRVALVAMILLLYWVFIFILITVFDFKVFKENITETFYLSVIGILALLAGAVIVNVMFNLTKISEVLSGERKKDEAQPQAGKNTLFYAGLLSFPLIFALLYFGDLRTSAAKENYLINSAKYIVDNNGNALAEIAEFALDSSYFANTESALSLLSNEIEHFPSVSIILQGDANGKPVVINITRFSHWRAKSTIGDYIFSCSVEEKEYLLSIFNGQNTSPRFSAADGNYELYYPINLKDKKLVLYCTDSQRYGKLGS